MDMNGESLVEYAPEDAVCVKVNKLKREALFKQLNRLIDQNRSTQQESKERLEVRLELLQSIYDKFEVLQDEIELVDLNEIAKTTREDFSSVYCSTKALFLEQLNQHRSTNVTPNAGDSASRQAHGVSKNLPKIQLTKFNGNQRDWLDFISVFSALVHDNGELGEIEKFQYLRSCLGGDAAKLVQSLEITSDNYTKALCLLKGRYDNKRFIFQSHLKNIFNNETRPKHTLAGIREFMDDINANIRALESVASKQQIADGILLHLIVSKLDRQTQIKWEEEVATSADKQSMSADSIKLPSWEDLCKFLEQQSKTMDIVDASPQQSKSTGQAKNVKAALVSSNGRCEICLASPTHSPFKCVKFMNQTVTERFNTAKNKRLYLNCLSPEHMMKDCSSKHKCQHCNKKHHTLLLQKESEHHHGQHTPEGAEKILSSALKVSQNENGTVLATAVVNAVHSNGTPVHARALLDSASQLHFIKERMAQQLGLRRRKVNIEVLGIGTNSTNARQMCTIKVQSMHNNFSRVIEAIIIPSITSCQPNQVIDISSWKIPANTQLADKRFNVPGNVDILIGAELFYELLEAGQIKLNGPVMQNTVFGWVVTGTYSQSQTQNSKYKAFVSLSCETSTDKLLEKFWALEERINQKHLSSEEKVVEDFFAATTSRCLATGKFVVRLPFKEDPQVLGKSFDIANKRLSSIQARLKRDEGLRNDYHAFISEYEELNHMKPIHVQQNENYNFIPHHAVIKSDSSTTKLRVVFDASCKTSNGKSLNSILRVGPTLQDDIFTILNRFRAHKFVIMADIAKMYGQIWVNQLDAPSQCILWKNSQEDLCAYQLQTVTYGTTCAPYLAVKCLQQLASDEKATFPIGSKVTLSDFYVDNLMTGGSTVAEVIEIKRQVTSLLQRGGFPLRKFASNNEGIIADIPTQDRELMISVDDLEYIKTLGLKWSPEDDAFLFQYSPSKSTGKMTKRMILSHVASFFDPLSLLNPLIVSCKILLQQLWALKLDWDDVVPETLGIIWQKCQEQLQTVHQFKIPRYVIINNTTQLHVFADASMKAYGACVYAVTRTTLGVVSSLMCARSRVAPTKVITLPRLELCAAVLAAGLVVEVSKIFTISHDNIHCYTDSEINLAWIAGEPSRWKTFVANRVSKIQQITSIKNWHHVSSASNPADLISRGATMNELFHNQLWFNGPSQLLQGIQHSSWHPPPLNEQALPEQRGNIAYLNRFIKSCQKTTPREETRKISVMEFEEALITICKHIKNTAFSAELKELRESGTVQPNSSILSLSPMLKDGIIRVGGRLQNSTLSYSAQHPIVLPGSHPFVQTLIKRYHHQNLHAGVNTLNNILRDKYWILNARNVIKRIIHQCIMCYRNKPIIRQQVLGDLPRDRVQASHPFEIAGVDYCGPFYITHKIRGRSPQKIYMAIFICFATKAVHFELVPDLTTAAFIAALKRFVARRGYCRVIYSDNATNFVGANRELKEMLRGFLSQQHQSAVHHECTNIGMEWKFIPPRSPNFGGLWESAVKQAKFHLRRAVGSTILTYDELHTVICQAEAIVNSRPLTPLGSDPNDLRPLTPAHFLIGRLPTSIPEPTQVSNNHLMKKYQMIQWIQQQFWRRWHNEYLKELQQRTKWKTVNSDIKINDLVILKDENTPPINWHMGRIISTSPGADGHVRVVTIKTNDGTYQRAISKVCKLPID